MPKALLWLIFNDARSVHASRLSKLSFKLQKGANSSTEVEGMPLRFSGKVSGILDDLSDAMSMLHDLLPSAASDVHIQVRNSLSQHQENKSFWTPSESLALL